MKIKFSTPHIWNGAWLQPANADGTGGYVVNATYAEVAALKSSGVKFEVVEDEPPPKFVPRNKRSV